MKKFFLLLGLGLMFACSTPTTEVIIEDAIDSCKTDTTQVVVLDTIVPLDTIKVVVK